VRVQRQAWIDFTRDHTEIPVFAGVCTRVCIHISVCLPPSVLRIFSFSLSLSSLSFSARCLFLIYTYTYSYTYIRSDVYAHADAYSSSYLSADQLIVGIMLQHIYRYVHVHKYVHILISCIYPAESFTRGVFKNSVSCLFTCTCMFTYTYTYTQTYIFTNSFFTHIKSCIYPALLVRAWFFNGQYWLLIPLYTFVSKSVYAYMYINMNAYVQCAYISA